MNGLDALLLVNITPFGTNKGIHEHPMHHTSHDDMNSKKESNSDWVSSKKRKL